jgi:ATP-binding cassette subfamily B protein
MSFPFLKQFDSADCGPTCLVMISKYHGRSVALETLRQRAQIGKEGVNLLGLSDAAEQVGFRTQAVRIDFGSLIKKALLPCILHWNQNHFVVLYKVRRNKLLIADPARGIVDCSYKEFKSHWIVDPGEQLGIALLLEPTAAFHDDDVSAGGPDKRAMAFGNIYNYLRPFRKLVFQLLFSLAIATLLQIILPFLTQSIVDTGINNGNMPFIYIIILAQAFLILGKLSVDFVRSWILLHISNRINISILTDFLIKLMKLPVSFFDTKKTGDILQRMNDHQRIESFLTGSSISILFSLFNLLVFSTVLATFNINIFACFAVSSLLYSVWVISFLKRRRRLDFKRFDISSREQALNIQMVQGMQEIKLNGVEKPIRWNWERLQSAIFKLNMKGLALNQWQQSGASLLNEGKNLLITCLSASAVIKGQMTLGAMLAVQYIMGQLNSPIEQMISFLQSWQNARISLERLNEIHGLEDEEPVGRGLMEEIPVSFTKALAGGGVAPAPAASPVSGSAPWLVTGGYGETQNGTWEHPDRVSPAAECCLFLDHVTFAYPGAGNDPVLNDISLSIARGRTTAIVGVSGSGKTTLLKLLLKFYDPEKGEIRVGNMLLSNISHRVWRKHCGVVMQESFIFSDTIRYNIAVGGGKVDLPRLENAIRMANIQDFIYGLPLGLNTKIGAEGMGISMGQKQRILIARAVYRDPDLIFLDEASNSLDANNERIIVKNLETFLKGKTVVIVAHRLSTVRHADNIIVLNKGRISESGNHAELIAARGEYYDLVRNQLELGD